MRRARHRGTCGRIGQRGFDAVWKSCCVRSDGGKLSKEGGGGYFLLLDLCFLFFPSWEG